MSGRIENTRHHVRYTYAHAVQYDIPAAAHTLRGFILNISEAGLCFSSPVSLREGEEVRIKTKLPFPRQRGHVRWCMKVDENVYKAGIQFA